MMLNVSILATLPPTPASLQGLVLLTEDGIVYTTHEKASDAILLSWLQRCRSRHPQMRLVIEDHLAFSERLLGPRGGQVKGAIGLSAEDSVNVDRARNLLVRAAVRGASDVHVLLRPGFTEVQVRIKGYLRVLDRLSAEDGKLLERTLFQGFESTKDSSFNPGEFQNAQIVGTDIHPTLTGVRLSRGPAYPAERGGGIVVGRLQYGSLERKAAQNAFTKLALPSVPASACDLDHLGYTPVQVRQLKDMMEATTGIVLVTGPTGSGKTTLIYELLKHHAHTFPFLRQVTIEDPVEYPMPWAVQMAITNATNEADTSDAFAERLRTTLRLDPDAILLGEIRGAGSALAALNAAMTGHLVLSTLHTSDPYMALDRLELLDPVRLARKITCDHKLIVGLVAQRLLPRLCPSCKLPFNPDAMDTRLVDKLSRWGDLSAVFVQGPGCSHCDEDGSIGRHAIGEVVRTDAEFMRLANIEGTDIARKAMRTSADFSGSMLSNAMAQVFAGAVSPLDARTAAAIVYPEQDI